ncbi:hypothetical protein N7541_010747 [Penicillium brevicompactum]|uniref:COP9 signalosome complex subunit 3 N-terminal helical repeats domain-containing protein n=1 Tax=Penicillium brevicompactum TaxID=5074 RepID=A0A9W9QPB4_PENBR|nr:hypothetical protein N7541_010747 [Penicillium brevicompactum]
MALISDLLSASAHLHNPMASEEYDRRIRELVDYLKKLLSTKTLDSSANDESSLDHLDPSADSIAYLYVLGAQIQRAQERSGNPYPADIRPAGKLWTRAAQFLTKFDRVQVRYTGREWRQLLEVVAQASLAASKPLLGAKLVRDAMIRLDPSATVFTSNHVLLVKLCLQAKAYSYALPILNKHICHFPTLPEPSTSEQSKICADNASSVSFITSASGFSSKLSYQDYLRYFLYGGMIYMALKEWRSALHFLGAAVSMPVTSSVSLIMVEAYKKWILVGLLEKGKLCSPPSITTPHVVKLYQSLARPYVSLAQAFELGDMKRLRGEVDAAMEIWYMDNNFGLVTQVVDAFFRQTVVKLGKTFAALTVADLAKQIFPSPAEKMVTESDVSSLIMSGALDASLVQKQDPTELSILRFSTSLSFPRLSHELDMQSHLKKERLLMENLVRNLEEINNAIGMSEECLDNLQRGQAWAASNGTNPTPAEGGLEMDEDLMGDMS